MALSAAERLELEQLEKEFGDSKSKGLTPMEEAELAELEAEFGEKADIGMGRAARIGLERGTSFGFRPVIAGTGGFLGGLKGSLEQGKSLKESLQFAGDSYGEAKRAALDEQRLAEEQYPKTTLTGDVAGSALTIPFVAARGLKGVAGLGAVQGAGKGLSEAESVGEGVADVAIGAGTAAGTYGLLKGAGKLADTRAGKYVGEKLKAGAEKIAQFPKKVLTKISSAMTGVNEKDISTYAKEVDRVNEIIKRSGDDLSDEVDALRQRISNSLRSKRQELGSKIGAALDDVPNNVEFSVSPVLSELEKVRAQLNPRLNADQVDEINKLIDLVRGESRNGFIKARSLFEVKEFLQERAKGAYQKAGQIFMPGKDVQRAAKGAAAQARKMFNKVSPEIAEANNKLAQLHLLESRINRNLLKPGTSPSSILTAGSGANPKNVKDLARIGQATGDDFLKEAEILSAAKAFKSPSILPSGPQTGIVNARVFGSAALGGSIGGPAGAAVGAILSSPQTLKLAINTKGAAGKFAKGLIRAVSPKGLLNDEAIERAVQFYQTPEGKAFLANSGLLKEAEGLLKKAK